MAGDKAELMAHVLVALFGSDAKDSAGELKGAAIANGSTEEAAAWQRAEWALEKLNGAAWVPEEIPTRQCQELAPLKPH